MLQGTIGTIRELNQRTIGTILETLFERHDRHDLPFCYTGSEDLLAFFQIRFTITARLKPNCAIN